MRHDGLDIDRLPSADGRGLGGSARKLAAAVTAIGGCVFGLVAAFAVVMACEDRGDGCGQSWQYDSMLWLGPVVALASVYFACAAWSGRYRAASAGSALLLVLGTFCWALLSRAVPELRVAGGPGS